ncbi:MBL fold metallo-hydrolase [Marispirochaeta sp.]|jgi:hydroxyacylglutathione hydrolase|uniref:MBL fold metallo-hydrolase n=1 Tax=Marispirochaeta sp. TaxID=2038653 RepID=UPI0029C9593C|nr:MBL fold metallo-hydrolase [Marispirochaeta sp.]
MVERIIVGSLSTNAYIYSEWKKECLLIDPGGDMEELLAHMTIKNLKPLGIICTHGHLDHVAGVYELQRHFRDKDVEIPVAIHTADAHYLGKNASESHRISFEQIGIDLKTILMDYDLFFPEPDIILNDGDTVLNSSLKVIHTPGHTPGSICLYSESQSILFSGDTLFFEGVGRTDLMEGDGEAILKSIRERLFVLPQETRVFPGHGPNTSIEREIKNNPFMQ